MADLDFSQIQDEFMRRVSRIVWCSVATVDRQGRPRQRILHPIWEGSTGWIATGRNSFKAKHLAANPNVSLSYWDPQQEQVYVDAVAEWEDRVEEKRRLWQLFKDTPPPLGYDPGLIWKSGPDDAGFGILRLTPRRIELSSLFLDRAPRRVWRG